MKPLKLDVLKAKSMNRIKIKFCIIFCLLSVSVGVTLAQKNNWEVLNICDSLRIDSTNHIIRNLSSPFTFSKNQEYYMLNIASKHTICIDINGGYCFYKIALNRRLYYISIVEFIVGYDYCFVYNAKTKKIYSTDKFNFNNEAYKIIYKNCNLTNQSIVIQYKMNNLKEKIPLHLCVNDTIKL